MSPLLAFWAGGALVSFLDALGGKTFHAGAKALRENFPDTGAWKWLLLGLWCALLIIFWPVSYLVAVILKLGAEDAPRDAGP